jgi:hypothetical protein
MTKSFIESVGEYFDYWTQSERGYVEALSSSDEAVRLATLQGAAGYFRVARNFPTSHDVGRGLPRLKPALDVLHQLSASDVNEANLSRIVTHLRGELGRLYGGADLLSAATKFLWLRSRDVVIIFDGQARAALKAPYGAYDAYLQRWFRGYQRNAAEIAEACSQFVASLSEAAPVADRRDIELPEWFRRRVYDIYLWNAGKPVLTPSSV